MSMPICIQFFSVGCGDAIALRFLGTHNEYHNFFIDAGYSSTYRATIQKELIAIEERQETVDLWCISHTDDDHINGVIAFLEDPFFKTKQDFIKQFWFNWSDYPAPNNNPKISVAKGIKLRAYLKTNYVK